MATHSSILAWRIPRTEEPGGLQSMEGCRERDTTERLTLSLSGGRGSSAVQRLVATRSTTDVERYPLAVST